MKTNEEDVFDYSLDWTEMAQEWMSQAREMYETAGLLIVYAILAAAIPLVISILAWPAIIIWFNSSVAVMSQSTFGRVIGLFSLTVLAVLLYLIREHFKRLYGVAEIVIGLTGCWVGLSKISGESLASIVAVASGVYVTVRGIDNFVQGRTFTGVLSERLKAYVKLRAQQKYPSNRS